MKVAFRNTEQLAPEPAVAKEPVKVPYHKLSAKDRFNYDMQYKAWKRVLKEYAADIAMIQEEEPGWLPTFRFVK